MVVMATYLIGYDSLCQASGHHLCQHLLLALGLSGQLGSSVTKPGYVVLETEGGREGGREGGSEGRRERRIVRATPQQSQ